MLTTDINLRPSKGLTYALMATLASSLLCIASLPLPMLYKLLLLVITFSYGLNFLQRDCLLKSKSAITTLALTKDGWLINTAQQLLSGELRGDSTLTSLVMVLRFNIPGHKGPLSCLICRDSVDSETYRRLLVLLRTTHAGEAEQLRRKRGLIH